MEGFTSLSVLEESMLQFIPFLEANSNAETIFEAVPLLLMPRIRCFDKSWPESASIQACNQLQNQVSIQLSPIIDVAKIPLPGAIANLLESRVISTAA